MTHSQKMCPGHVLVAFFSLLDVIWNALHVGYIYPLLGLCCLAVISEILASSLVAWRDTVALFCKYIILRVHG